MYIEKVRMEGNIAICRGTVMYNYLITPINSLYTAKTQKTTLIETMSDLILNINMPGYLMIKPRSIQNTKIYKYYLDEYKKHGHREHLELVKKYISDIKKINDKKQRYQYDIYLCFCDGRNELKKGGLFNSVSEGKSQPYDKKMMELFQSIEKEIYKKLSMLSLSMRKLTDKQEMQQLLQYIAIPVEGRVIDHCSIPEPEKLTYRYEIEHQDQIKELYTKTLIATKFNEQQVRRDDQVDDVINCLQLESYPVDTFVKFDLEHTKEFKRNMQARKVKVDKELRTYYSLTDAIDEEGRKAKQLAAIGEKRDESIERSKIKWQLFFRLRSSNEELLDKYAGNLRRMLSNSSITLSDEFGEQERLAENLFPWKTSFVKYIQLTDIKYFARFNWLGGLFIGEEHEGFIETYTKPGNKPIFTDISNTLTEAHSATNSTTTIYAGETGSGKTQQADLRVFTYMLFRGMRVLCIDPKGDRGKKIKMFGNSASHLVIGSADCQNGMFDGYLMHQEPNEQLNQIKRDIDALSRALHDGVSIRYHEIEQAHFDMLDDLKDKKLKRATFTVYLEKYLMRYDEFLAKELLTLRTNPYGRLFFADENTQYDAAFNLTKYYNLITFHELPIDKKTGEFDPDRMQLAVFTVVFSRIQEIIVGFMKRYEGEEKILVVDEFRVWKRIDGGEAIVDNAVRMGRSWFTHNFIITQALSDAKNLMENTGQYFIGSLASQGEIRFVLEQLKLSNNETVAEALQDRTTSEGTNVDKKYRFLYVDYNGRKCITRNILPPSFKEAFTTLKKVEKKQAADIDFDEAAANREIDAFLKEDALT